MQVERSEMESLYNVNHSSLLSNIRLIPLQFWQVLGYSLDQPIDNHNSKPRGKGLHSRPYNPKAPAPPGETRLDRLDLRPIVDQQLAIAGARTRNGAFDPSAALRKMAMRRISELRQEQRDVR